MQLEGLLLGQGSAIILKFLVIFEQGVPHCHFALGHADYVADPGAEGRFGDVSVAQPP